MANDVVKALITNSYLEDIAGAIREKGGASGDLLPSEMPSAIMSISGGSVLQEKIVNPTGDVVNVLPDSGYNGLSRVTVNAIDLQSKEVNPSGDVQIVEADVGKSGLSSVRVNAVALQQKVATPTAEAQQITPDSGYTGLSRVTVGAVNPILAQEKTVNPATEQITVEPDGAYNCLSRVIVSGAALQVKSVTPSASAQTIEPDEQFIGLSKVNVAASSPLELQTKNVNPSSSPQQITADQGYDALEQVNITAANLQSKTVIPNNTQQQVTPDSGYYGLSSVIVNATSVGNYQTKTVEVNQIDQVVEPDYGYDALESVAVKAAILQDKIVTPTQEQQTVLPDSGYYGLSSVTVEAGGGGGVYLARIYVATPPTKTSYYVGEVLNLTGIVVKGVMSDGTEIDITSSVTKVPANGQTLSATDERVNISYTWSGAESIYATSQSITVVPAHSVYGAVWDGASHNTWTRTDDAASFSNPQPYYAGMSETPSSPFDNIQPWAGMVRSENADAGTVVSIPKFYYKMDYADPTNTLGLKIQIAPASNGAEWASSNGFHCSPAHMDRGDGTGERDVIYVGRYHCGNSNYKSVTGVKPKTSITRSVFRSNIHNLGTSIWQWDYATLVTIWMLYLVEFANWNSQEKIGGGCSETTSTSSEPYNMGSTDSMPYHTGTTSGGIGSTIYGANQYRNIENLWGNVQDWCDGLYFNGVNVYGILNPAQFSDDANGTLIGVRPTTTNYIKSYSISNASGYEWAIHPSATTELDTYVGDYYAYYEDGTVLFTGGNYYQRATNGLFGFLGNFAEDRYGESVGSRLMILPFD